MKESQCKHISQGETANAQNGRWKRSSAHSERACANEEWCEREIHTTPSSWNVESHPSTQSSALQLVWTVAVCDVLHWQLACIEKLAWRLGNTNCTERLLNQRMEEPLDCSTNLAAGSIVRYACLPLIVCLKRRPNVHYPFQSVTSTVHAATHMHLSKGHSEISPKSLSTGCSVVQEWVMQWQLAHISSLCEAWSSATSLAYS